MIITRRTFLRATGAASLAAANPGGIASIIFDSNEENADQSCIVVLRLMGGADALALVPPMHDAEFVRLRGPRSDNLPLSDSGFALHPGLRPLLAHLETGRCQIVHAVGTSSSAGQHATEQRVARLGRTSVTSDPRSWLERSIGAASGARVDRLTDASLLADSLACSRSSDQSMLPFNAKGETGPRSNVEPALASAADLILRHPGIRGIEIEHAGWDTHEGPPLLAADPVDFLAAQLGSAMDAFARRLGDRLGRTTLVVHSEFGRLAHRNSRGGTEHGRGGCMFVLGGPRLRSMNRWGRRMETVALRGEWAGLDDVGAIIPTTDFRDILAEVLHRHVPRQAAVAAFPDHACFPVA